MPLRPKLGVLLVACLAWGTVRADGYSVLTHETIVDAVWTTDLAPILKARFPGLSDDQLREAHAFAYGGCLIQDMGYYPFGNKLFTDLTHYVRSGEFVEALLRDAGSADELAFALGALAHYTSDDIGHPLATNRAVPLLYPKLERRFGKQITYAENPAAHLKTEFGFDVAQVANGRFAPGSYHDFIGFQVAKPLLERAFVETYGLQLKDLFASEDLAIGSFRRAVSAVIPKMTKVAWETKQKEIVSATPGITREKFIQTISRASYEREWGTQYERPGVVDKVLAFFFRLIPKVGPFRALSFKAPTPEVERLFEESFNQTVAAYRARLHDVRRGQAAHFVDRDLDTGRPTRAGDYPLADEAFAQLLHRLAGRQFSGVTSDLRARILDFYQDLGRPIATKTRQHGRRWKQVLTELDALKRWQPESGKEPG